MNKLFSNFLMIIEVIFTYLTNVMKKIFKPEPDMRFKYSLDPETKLMRDKTGQFLFTFEMENEFSIFLKNGNAKTEFPYCESEKFPGRKFVYGFPIKCNYDCEIILESLCDEIVFKCQAGSLIPYSKIFENLE